MTHEQQIIITAEHEKKRKRKKRLHSLSDLAKKVAEKQKTISPSHAFAPAKKTRPMWKRITLWVLIIVGIPFALVMGSLLYITSPLAEQRLTSWVISGVNYLGKPMDLRVHIGLVRGFWDGAIKIYDVRIQDKFGPWLYIEEGTIHPNWSSIARATVAVLQYQNTGSVGSYLHGSGNPISELRKQASVYAKDVQSSYTPAKDNNIVNEIEGRPKTQTNTTQSSKESVNRESVSKQSSEIPDMRTATVPMVQIPYNPDVMDNLLEPSKVLKDKVTIGIEVGTLLGVRMPRMPRYEASTSSESTHSQEISLMPPWCAIDVGEFEVANFQLGPSGQDIFISARFHGQANAKQARLRSTFLAEKTRSGQWVLPFTQDLPGDVTLSMRELSGQDKIAMAEMRHSRRDFFDEKKFLGFFSLDYNEGDADFRVQWNDTLIGPTVLAGLNGFWTRFRVLLNVPAWPPTEEKPLIAQFVSRFGASFAGKNTRLRASLASAQFLWGGERLIIRDLNVLSPIKKTNISIKGSAGIDPQRSFGTQFNLDIKDLGIIASIFNINLQQNPIGGGIGLNAFITRGGDDLLWWTKPLPQIQMERSLPGLIISPYDFSILAKDVSLAVRSIKKSIVELNKYVPSPLEVKESNLPVASNAADAMQLRIKLASPSIQLPSGVIDDVFFSVTAKSVDGLKAPLRTAFKDEAMAAEYTNGQKDAGDVNFTPDGLPRGLVGEVFSRLGNMHTMGTGGMSFNWFMGGLHEESRTFHLELEDFKLNVPGVNSTAELRFLYALPIVKRLWPWIDGKLSLDVDSWRWIGLVTGSAARGSKVKLYSALRSFYDADGVPRQYLNTSVEADRFDSTGFIVRNIYGTAESQNLHELVDILALSTGNLRDSMQKKLVYKSSPNTVLMKSTLKLGAGRTGGFNWDSGDFNLRVIDEDASFTVKMKGDVSAILNGTYDFRKRVVGLKQMQFIDR